MTREEAQRYTDAAIASLGECLTEDDLVRLDNQISNTPEYLALPLDLLHDLEEAYEKRAVWLLGAGGG